MTILDISKARSWTLAKAKSHLSELVDEALDGKPQVIARRGSQPVVVVARNAIAPSRLPSMLDVLRACPAGELPIPPRATGKREPFVP